MSHTLPKLTQLKILKLELFCLLCVCSVFGCRFYTFGGFGVPLQGYLGESESFFEDEVPERVGIKLSHT